MKKSSLSKKKETALYSEVQEEIMQARIKIARILTGDSLGRHIDNILSDLTISCPEKAINLFKTSKR